MDGGEGSGNLTTALAEAIVRAPIHPGTRVMLRVRGGDVVAVVAEKATEAGASCPAPSHLG